MKYKRILIPLIVFLSLRAQAQLNKIYGYRQLVYGGAAQMNDNPEDKALTNKAKQSISEEYFIFIVTGKNKTTVPQELWINKQRYNFTLDTVKKLPFVLLSAGRNEEVSKDTLVKFAAGCVIQLKYPTAVLQQNVPASIRKTVNENALVLTYRYKGRHSKIFIRRLKQLPPVYNP